MAESADHDSIDRPKGANRTSSNNRASNNVGRPTTEGCKKDRSGASPAEINPKPIEDLTILRAVNSDPEKTAKFTGKRFVKDGDLWVEIKSESHPYLYAPNPIPYFDIESLYRVLREQARAGTRNRCYVHGMVKPELIGGDEPLRRLKVNFDERPTYLLVLDLDDLPDYPIDDPAACAARAREHLPDWLRSAAVVWQATSKFGLEAVEGRTNTYRRCAGIGPAKLRLWFILNRALSVKQKGYLFRLHMAPRKQEVATKGRVVDLMADRDRRGVREVRHPKIDGSVWHCVQPSYFSNPQFDGADEPLRERWGTLPGDPCANVPDYIFELEPEQPVKVDKKSKPEKHSGKPSFMAGVLEVTKGDTGDGNDDRTLSPERRLSNLACRPENLAIWVPIAFPTAVLSGGGWDVPARDVGLDSTGIIRFHSEGGAIFSSATMDHPGRRPFALVAEFAAHLLPRTGDRIHEAALWICDVLALDPEDFGLRSRGAKPTVFITGSNLPEVVRQCATIMAETTNPLFNFGGSLVRVARQMKKDGSYEPVFRTVDPHGVRVDLGEAIHFLGFNAKGEEIDRNIPVDHATALCKSADRPEFPPIKGFLRGPTLWTDGDIRESRWELIDAPGYDPRTRYYLGEVPKIGELGNTREAAVAAANRFRHLFGEVAFTDRESGLAVALSGIACILLKPLIGAIPAHVFDAPQPRAGKGYAMRMIQHIAIGCSLEPLTLDEGQTQEDLVKGINAAQREGRDILLLDNMNDMEINSNTVMSAITEPERTFRILGVSENLRVPNVLLFINGNHVRFSRDMTGRVIRPVINPGMADPIKRVFQRNPLAMIAENRAGYLADILTIIYAFHQNVWIDAAEAMPIINGFERWNYIVRSALIWAGVGDPWGANRNVVEGDEDLALRTKFIQAWETLYPDGATVARALADWDDDADQAAMKTLKACINELPVGRHPKDLNRRVGGWLASIKDNPVAGVHGDRCMSKIGITDGAARWAVVDVKPNV